MMTSHLLLLWFGCAGLTPTDGDLSDPGDGFDRAADDDSDPDELPLTEGPPTLEIEEPARGDFVGAGPLMVRGRVIPGGARIESVELNDTDVDLDGEGRFEVDLGQSDGIAIIDVRVRDEDGERVEDALAVHAGSIHKVGTTIEGAVRLQIGANLIDDDQPDHDDVAGIAEALLSDPAIVEPFVGVDVETDYFWIRPTAVDFAEPDVDLDLSAGTLDGTVVLADLWLDYDLWGTGWYDWVATSGSAWVDTVTLEMNLSVSTSGGSLQVHPTLTAVDLQGFGLTVEWVPDFMEGYIADWVEETIEEQIAAAVEVEVAALLAGFLEAFAVETSLGDVSVALSLASIELTDDAVRVELDGWISAPRVVDVPSAAGSLQTSGSAPGWSDFGTDDLAAAIDDDFVNQAAFALWYSGMLDALVIPPDQVSASGVDVPAPIGPLAGLELSLGLPPVISAPSQPGRTADVAVGEWRLTLTREDGARFVFSVQLSTGITVDLGESGAIAFTIDEQSEGLTSAVAVLEHPPDLDPTQLAALARVVLPAVIMSANDRLPTFDIPPIDIGRITAVEGLAGVSVGLADAEFAIDDNGWLLLDGSLSP